MVLKAANNFLHFEEEKRYQGLWKAVILQAFQDAMSANAKHEFKTLKRSATFWLRGTTSDFYLVCSHAGMEPSKVINRARYLGII